MPPLSWDCNATTARGKTSIHGAGIAAHLLVQIEDCCVAARNIRAVQFEIQNAAAARRRAAAAQLRGVRTSSSQQRQGQAPTGKGEEPGNLRCLLTSSLHLKCSWRSIMLALRKVRAARSFWYISSGRASPVQRRRCQPGGAKLEEDGEGKSTDLFRNVLQRSRGFCGHSTSSP